MNADRSYAEPAGRNFFSFMTDLLMYGLTNLRKMFLKVFPNPYERFGGNVKIELQSWKR